MIAPNTLIGNRYKVIRPLGGGGMKQVYLAADVRLANRPCALAEMIDSFANPKDRDTAAAAFHREADMLARLTHDRIVRIYDTFSEGNRHLLVMEYAEGETLEDKLKAAGGRLDQSTAIDIALQLLDALEYLHSRTPPVIYRDLKPSNVMVSREGRVKVVDFGIARFFQPLATATMVGTQGYAPPEQYKGKVEARSDLYALGATMHFMLTGRDPALEPPFMFPPVQELCPGCNHTLADLINESLALDLKDRVSSAADFKRRLTRLKNPTATSLAPPRAPAPSPSSSAPTVVALDPPSAPTVVALDTRSCTHCAKAIPAYARFCPYCSADLDAAPQPPGKRAGAARRVVLIAGAMIALFSVGFAGVYYYRYVTVAHLHPLKFEQVTLALSTRTGEALAPATTSFKDTDITSDKYLKWSATFDNELEGIETGTEKIEARFFDPGGVQVASSKAEQVVGRTDSRAVFDGVVLIPDSVAMTPGEYKVALYLDDALHLGDEALGEENFWVSKDLAAEEKAQAPVVAAAAPSPAVIPRQEQSQQSLLAAFRGCWHTNNDMEIVESRTQTGTFALPTKFVPGRMGFCWNTRSDGTVYFQPPADGYAQLTEADRKLGVTSEWINWTTTGVDPHTHRVKLRARGIDTYNNGEEDETENNFTCRPEGREMDCENKWIENLNHQPWFEEVDHFHMERTH